MFESLECMERDVAAAAETDLYLGDRRELSDGLLRVRQLIRRLEAFELALTRAHDVRKAWKDDGANSAKQWHRDRRGMTPGEASKQVRTATELQRLPKTAAKVASGEISTDQASVAVRAAEGLPTTNREVLDALVAGHAPDSNVNQLRRAVNEFCHEAEPDTLAERERFAHDRRGVTLRPCADGGVWIEGRLDTVAGEAAMAATSALAAPRGDDDDRTPAQRVADALGDLCLGALRWGDLPVDGGRRPAIAATVDWETLQRRAGASAARLDHAGQMSGALARQLACDADIHRVITRGGSEILDVGRTTRLVSVAQRRALIARDRGCVGCDAPPAWTDAHHVIHWADGGSTDLTNLVLLCRGCHTGVHHRGWQVVRGEDGRWTVLRPARDTTGDRHETDSPSCAGPNRPNGSGPVHQARTPSDNSGANGRARPPSTDSDDRAVRQPAPPRSTAPGSAESRCERREPSRRVKGCNHARDGSADDDHGVARLLDGA